MTLFTLGLVLFFVPHFYSALRSRAEGRDIRRKMGEAKYMGLYSLVTGLGLVLMIWGYSKIPTGNIVFTGPHELHHRAWVPMLLAMVLLASAYTPMGRIKKAVQHPMMMAVLIWSLTHLLMGGEFKQIAMFGAFALYSLVSLFCAYRRGTELSEKSPRASGDVLAIIIGLGLTGILMHGAHLYAFGASPM